MPGAYNTSWIQVDRLLGFVAATTLLAVAWADWPGGGPNTGAWLLTTFAAGMAVVGSCVARRGSVLAFRFLWATFGATLGLAVLGILSIGVFYSPAAALLAAAIVLSPREIGDSRIRPVYLLVQFVAFVTVLGMLFLDALITEW